MQISTDRTIIIWALRSKAKTIASGHYGPEDFRGDNAEWIAHLEGIANKLEDKQDHLLRSIDWEELEALGTEKRTRGDTQ